MGRLRCTGARGSAMMEAMTTKRPRQPAAGRLLVATPRLLDPNFSRTVVYLIAHGDEGSAGLVLNRRSETAVHNVLPAWTACAAKPQAIYAGGPVQPGGAMCLGVSRIGVSPADVEGVVGVHGSVVLVDLDADPDLLTGSLLGVRIFAGHAGWAGGQLAEEIDEGAWHVVDSLADDVLAGARTDLWFTVLRRQGFPLAWQAYLPATPDRN